VTNDKKFPPNPRLHNARVERGWSQQQLADQVGTTSVTISRWENGLTFPSPYFRQKLREVFGKTPAELGLMQSPSDSTLSSPSPPLQSRTARVWTVPFTRNPFFTGREALLVVLYERLSTARMAALTQAQALYGLGGVGKTQTAAEYAFRYGDEYAHVFWMLAATRETLDADFVKLAQLLDLPEKGEQDQSQIVAAVKRWLAAKEGWLLILDNADDLPLAQAYLPASHKGYVLFTTRDQVGGTIAASIEVEKLTPQDGALLLLRWSKRLDRDAPLDQARAADRTAAERIAKEMDGLPLALVQAGAYIEETRCSLEAYRRLYTTHRKTLLARHSRLILDYPDTVATTWSLSFQRVEQQSPAAADVLRLCTFLAPDAIPEELLMRGIAEPGLGPGAQVVDPLKLNEALGVLLKYSLVRREENENRQILSVHRLVQIVLKVSMDLEIQRLWAERTVRVVSAAFPEADYGAGENQQYYLHYYLPHAKECAVLIEQYHLYFPEAAQLLFQAGAFLYVHGFYSQSQSFHQQALVIREQVFGSNHPAAAESLNVLAVLARLQGHYEQAERFHRQALVIRKKMLGPEHPATVESLNNLGVLYRTQGKYELAEPLLREALSVNEQTLGSEHPDTLITFLNLAKLHLEQRKYEQAEQLLQQTLAASERVLEPGHPFIARNLNLLATLSYEQGDLEEAEILWKRSLAILQKTFGLEHPTTAEVLDNLAKLSLAQGRYAQAQSLYQKALSICQKTLGPEHPYTIAVHKHLIRIMNKGGIQQDRTATSSQENPTLKT